MYREFTKKEKDWIKKFESVMKQAPNSLFLFIGEGVAVFTTDENGEKYYDRFGSVDPSAPSVGIITNIQYDGGAY